MKYYTGLLRSAYGKLGLSVKEVAEMTVSDILLCEKGYEDKLDDVEVNYRKLARIILAVNADPKSQKEIDMDKFWPTRHHVKSKQEVALTKSRMQEMLDAYNKSKQVN